MLPYITALAVGLLIGLERERSHPGRGEATAGSRTFALLGLAGALAGSIDGWVVAAGLLGAAALLTVGYLRSSREDPGATTEFAALATFLIGAVAWADQAVAAAVALAVLVLLMSKDRIHSFAREVVSDTEMTDAVRFLVMALVVLPLLPDRDVGPYGALNPARIWQLVLALSGISWVGYIATRALGAARGPLVTGLAGGFVSASATTASMGRLARRPDQRRVAVAGAYLASVATFVQLAGIVAVADRPLLRRLWPALAGGAAVLVLLAAMVVRRRGERRGGSSDGDDPATGERQSAGRPFALAPALLLAGVLTLALLGGCWIVDVVGQRATVLASAAAGLADAHAGALTAATLHHQGQISTSVALFGVAGAIATNTCVKCVLAFVAGGRRFGASVSAGLLPAVGLFLGLVAIAAA